VLEPIKKKREPKPNTEILKVDAAVDKKDAKILVLFDDDYGYTPVPFCTSNFFQFNASLTISDINTGKNKYYKIQIVEADNQYYFFNAWGRVGTRVGGNKLHETKGKDDAVAKFIEKFEGLTANKWTHRQCFKKKPAHYFMVNIDDGLDEADDDKPNENKVFYFFLKFYIFFSARNRPTATFNPSSQGFSRFNW
jgi:hypothetical protein